jgi:hypothetical protein
MTRRALLGGVAALLVSGWTGRALAQGAMTTTTDQYFRVEATPGTDRRGQPIVWGYVYTLSGRGSGGRPRLLLETLDAAGKPIAQQLVYVDEDFASGRVYYEARPQTPGPAYRATVQSVVSNFNGAP